MHNFFSDFPKNQYKSFKAYLKAIQIKITKEFSNKIKKNLSECAKTLIKKPKTPVEKIILQKVL